jgi:hypothetical protein
VFLQLVVAAVLGMAPEPAGSENEVCHALREGLHESSTARSGPHVLVATVADWREPLLAYVGTRERDAIVGALAEARFIVTSEGERLRPTAGRSLQHGVFHRWGAGKTQDPLHLILVPESPLTGVDKGILRAILECAREVVPRASPELTVSVRANPDAGTQLAAFTPRRPPSLFVLGPTYSGSTWSIRAAIQGKPGQARVEEVAVVSGSATGTSLPDVFQDGGIPFERTVHSNAELGTALRNFLEENDWKNSFGGPGVAILSERSTEYGDDLRDALELTSDSDAPHVLVLPFPLHIAWRLGEDALLPRTDAGIEDEIQLPEGVERSSAEAALDHLLATISMDGYHYVGIIASDVRDRLFLTRRIRQYSPDVRIILFESDILYSLRSFAETRGALIVSTYPLLNENQLWSRTSADAGVDDPHGGLRRQFESDPAEGAYNATLTILARMKLKGLDRPLPPLLEYRAPFDAGPAGGDSRPPVWISMQGGRDAWPLDIVSPGATDGGLVVGPSEAAASGLSDFPAAFHLFPLLLSLGVLMAAAWFIGGPDSRALISRASSLPAMTTPVTIGKSRPSHWAAAAYVVTWTLWTWFLWQLLHLWFRPSAGRFEGGALHVSIGVLLATALVASLLCAGLPLLGSWESESFKRTRDFVRNRWGARASFVFVALFPLALVAWPVPDDTPGFELQRQSESFKNTREFVKKRWGPCATVVLVGLFLLTLVAWPFGDTTPGFELQRQRYVHLASGVSPLPLLYLLLLFVTLGALSISAYAASRRIYGRPRTVQWPFKTPQAWVGELRIDSNSSNVLVLLSVIAVGLLISGFVWIRLGHQLEDGAVAFPISLLLCTAPVLLSVSCALALLRWSTVRSCLRRVRQPEASPSASTPVTPGAPPSLQARPTQNSTLGESPVAPPAAASEASPSASTATPGASPSLHPTPAQGSAAGESPVVPLPASSESSPTSRRGARRQALEDPLRRSLLFSPQPTRRERPNRKAEAGSPRNYLRVDPRQTLPEWRLRLARTLSEEFVLIRRLFVFPLFGTPLLILGLATYPIEPNRLLLLVFSSMLVVFVLLAFALVIAVEREPLVAALEDRTSGSFDFSPAFLVRVAALAIPLLFAFFGSKLSDLGTSTLNAIDQLASLVK